MYTALRFRRSLGIAVMLGLILPFTAVAQTPASTAILLLRPHCEGAEAVGDEVPSATDFLRNGVGDCKNFGARDPQTQQTDALNVGDTLDMDLVVYNPQKVELTNARAWLSYDPQTLQGVKIELKDMPVPTPGESDFSAADGLAKINGTPAPTQKVSSWLVVVGRVQFKVLRAPRAGITPLGFYDLQPNSSGHTRVLGVVEGAEKNILPTELGSLVVQLKAPASSSPAPTSSVSTSATSSVPTPVSSSVSSTPDENPPESSASSVPGGRSPFVLLQIQNLRATTEGGAIYLAWDKLPSSDLAGYNVYYGTEKGRYIQRKSVTTDKSSDIIRGLPENTVYYIAVRGYNSANEETAFSKEVMIKTGDPRSSTAPLSLDPNDQPPPRNPLTGDLTNPSVTASGAPSFLALMIAVCAITGTLVAFRRQLRVHNSAATSTPWTSHA